MSAPAETPLILTLKLDKASFEFFEHLRQEHFPPARNVIPAHLTLFHKLPGDQQQEISSLLARISSDHRALPLFFPALRFLGAGVAVEVVSRELLELRRALKSAWKDWLSPQDNQGYRPHITVQNKVSTPKARQLYDTLNESWQPLQGTGVGLLLWEYYGGPWTLAGEYSFGS